MSQLRLFHIFVVDDDPADVYLLRQAFKQAELNCEITVAEDGAEALRFIRSHEKSGDNPRPISPFSISICPETRESKFSKPFVVTGIWRTSRWPSSHRRPPHWNGPPWRD